MPVTEVSHDEETRTLTMIAEFAATPERVWEVYADPRQLEKVWGPRTYPATVVDHDLTPGGRVNYFMTSPEGEKFYGFWKVTEVTKPQRFEFVDYFADDSFNAIDDMPAGTNDYTFSAIDGGTRARYVSVFDSVEGLQKVLEMGVVEGATDAISQIDDLLAHG